MAEKIVLCRYDLAEIGEPKNYCGKYPIVKAERCAVHAERLPYWPVDDEVPANA